VTPRPGTGQCLASEPRCGCYALLVFWPQRPRGSLRNEIPDLRADVESWCVAEGIPRPSDSLITGFYVPMAAWVAEHVQGSTVVLGINGAQGTGKSTLARLLQRLLVAIAGLRPAVLSLDDLYLTAAERMRRAHAIHPLLATRGVPGTHDVDLGIRVVRALREGKTVALPRFDKAADERRPIARWPTWEGPCDVLIFEGWCVGARPQRAEDLREPINGLERLEDPTGEWRWYVNRELAGPYQRLFREVDLLVMLRPPDFEHVYAWREEQEAKLRAAGGGDSVMTPSALRRFVMHFERLTRFMWEEMPGRADAVVQLGGDHMPVQVTLADG
jgi:D-glycerate 3-kinase